MNTPHHPAPSSDAHRHLPASQRFWHQLTGRKISYFTLPLILVATLTEVVILIIGWKYQQVACLPKGMDVTFLSIGPQGAVILAVEVLKIPLAIWTASRHGWRKWLMLVLGLPAVCVLTFQLVKDMAVYEMGKALEPAAVMLKEAGEEEGRIIALSQELENQGKDASAVEEAVAKVRAERDAKLEALAKARAQGKAEHEEALRRNDEARQDAVSLTDYQKKELAENEARQAGVAAQFNADADRLTKAIADLRVARDAELARVNKDSADWEARKKAYDAAYAKWFAEESRIDNAFQAATRGYAQQKAAYEKARIEYLVANDLRRQFMKEPVPPGAEPVREINALSKPAALETRPSAALAALDGQIKAKEDELAAVNAKRRERVAQVETDARRLREDFDRRSATKREEADRKRDELLAAYAARVKEWDAEEKRLTEAGEASIAKARDTLSAKRPPDVVRAEIDAARKKADGLYEDRVKSIQATQVHRIATTVEIVRGWIFGERPVSIRITPKERGDLFTDQISMVRIWVYPVLAFIVAYLPTLMVEVGFSTLFESHQKRPSYRVGFLGRRLHDLYIRAGRQKVARAERMAEEVAAKIAERDARLAQMQEAHAAQLEEKEKRIMDVEYASDEAAETHAAELRRQEEAWVAKFGALADSLNRTTAEKDALRDLQKAEIERQVQLRQNSWSDRIAQLQQDLDTARAEGEARRVADAQGHQKKLLEVTEEAKTQVAQARRQLADAELAHVDATAKMAHDLKDALRMRDELELRQRQQEGTATVQLNRHKEEAARELEKAVRQERLRFERLQVESARALAAKDEEAAHKQKQRDQELEAAAESRIADVQARFEQELRRRQDEQERAAETRVRDLELRLAQEAAQKDEVAQVRQKQREQQLQAQFEASRHELRAQAARELQAREAELARTADARLREAETRFAQEQARREEVLAAKFQQREAELAEITAVTQRDVEGQVRQAVLRAEEAAVAAAKQREQGFALKAEARAAELRGAFDQELRARELEWERAAESRVRAAETRLAQEAAQKDEMAQLKLRQKEQQLLAQAEARAAEIQAQAEQELRRREIESERQAEIRLREAESRLKAEMQQQGETAVVRQKQREQQIQVQADNLLAEFQAKAAQESREREQEWERAAEARLRAVEARLTADLRGQEELAQSRQKQREQQLVMQADARLAEAARAAEVQLRDQEARLRQEAQVREEAVQARLRQREQEIAAQLSAQADARLATLQAQFEAEADKKARATEARLTAELRAQEELAQGRQKQREQQLALQAETRLAEAVRAAETQAREQEGRLRQEAQQKEEAAQARQRLREQELTSQLSAQFDTRLTAAQTAWEAEADRKIRAQTDALKAQVARTERERDAAKTAADEALAKASELEKKWTEVSALLGGFRR